MDHLNKAVIQWKLKRVQRHESLNGEDPTMNNLQHDAQAESWVKDLQSIASERDQAAFTRIFEHFAPLVRRFSLASEPGAALVANEIAQEVMIKVWNKAHLYDSSKAAVSTWIFTLARNATVDYLRKNGRYLSDINPDNIYLDLVDETADPFQSAVQKRDVEFIRQALTTLPDEQREALEVVYMKGMSHQQASEALQLPLGTIKSRVRLALSKLSLKGR